MEPGIRQIEFDDGTTQVILEGKDIGMGALEQSTLGQASAGGHNRFMGNVGESGEIPFSDGKVFQKLDYWMHEGIEVNMLLWRLGDDPDEKAPVGWIAIIPHVQEAEHYDPAGENYPYVILLSKWAGNAKRKDTFDETFDETFI